VILDSVASTQTIRSGWRNLAQQYAASLRVVECICSDEVLHRARLAVRQRNIPGWHELEWSEVERVKRYYSGWAEEHLTLDAVRPFDDNLAAALAYCK
jgi:predicted kinase